MPIFLDNLIPPSDEFADVHDRVKYFCGVTNEELLEKLRTVEEKVIKSEWSGRIKDAKEKMAVATNVSKNEQIVHEHFEH